MSRSQGDPTAWSGGASSTATPMIPRQAQPHSQQHGSGTASPAASDISAFSGGGVNQFGTSGRGEVEQLRSDMLAQRREYQRKLDDLELDKRRLEADSDRLKAQNRQLQSALDGLQSARSKDTLDKTDGIRIAEELRNENAKLRTELSAALDTRLSHLRQPAVSMEQYKALLATAEALANVLRDGGQLTLDASNNSLLAARGIAASNGNNDDHTMGSPQHNHLGASLEGLAAASAPAAISNPGHDHPGPQHSRIASSVGAPPAAGPTGGGALTPRGQSPSLAGLSGPRSARASYSQLQAQRSNERLHRDPSSPQAAGVGGGNDQQQQQQPQSASPPVADVGVRENLVEGGKLVKIIRDAAPHSGKQWSFHNRTSDTQFVLDFTFGPQSDVVAIGDTSVDGRNFRVSVYPGETKEFVRGLVNGYRMSIKYGPPDDGYVPSSSVTDAELMPLVERVRALGSTNPTDAARECVAQGLAFVDVQFPPLSKSMAKSTQGVGPVVRWERPAAITPTGEKPEVAVSGFDAGGPTRGSFADPWLASAMAVLAPRRVEIVRAFSLSTTADELAGLHRVTLNLGGWWVVVAIDSFIPCCPKSNTPFGTHCRSVRDMWAPLLEKALAKAYGSYMTLTVGDVLEGISDITGCPTERIDWRAKDGGAFTGLLRHHKKNLCVVMTAPEVAPATAGSPSAITEPAGSTTEAGNRVSTIGFRPGHAYLVLATVHCEDFRLCLIANPDGAGDWSGAWSAKSELWVRHPSVKQACLEAERQAAVSIAGGVWMEWRDVAFNFAGAGMALLRPDWLDVRVANRFDGVKPQWMFELSVTKPTTVIIGIHQKDRRALTTADPERGYSAFLITCVACNSAGVWDAAAQSHGGTFWRGRDVHLELQLTPRDRAYYIIPRRYSEDRAKDVIVSMHVEDRTAVSASLKQPTGEAMNAVRYSPVWRFDPAPCPAVYPAPEMQVDRRPVTTLEW